MNFTTYEQAMLDALHRISDDYKSMERNEGYGSDNERAQFMQGIALAANVLEIRAIRRESEK